MARSGNARGFGRFLDLIGLVDPERDDDRASRRARDIDDDFDEEAPRAKTRRATTSGRDSGGARQSDARRSSSAGERSSSSRPDYGTRSRYDDARDARAGGTAQRFASGGGSSSRSSSRSVEDDYEKYVGEQAARRARPSEYEPFAEPSSTARTADYSSATRASSRHHTVISVLHSVNECKEVIIALIDKKSVLINLEQLDIPQTQRVLDTIGGASFAIGASLTKASERTWLITPNTVAVDDVNADAPEPGRGFEEASWRR